MNRSHRILRAVHRMRRERAPVAENRAAYEPFAEIKPFERLIRDLHGDGILDRTETEQATFEVIDVLVAQLAADHGRDGTLRRLEELIARQAFSRRRREDGSYSIGGGDRYIAEGCAALARAALLERALRAVGEVMRRRALVDHRDDLCWPEAYRRRLTEARDAPFRVSLRDATPGIEIGPVGSPSASEPAEAKDEIDVDTLAGLAEGEGGDA